MDHAGPSDRFGGVRILAVLSLVLVAAAPSARAGSPSNPAFLGIAMEQLPARGCFVRSVTPDSAAEAAWVQKEDRIVAIDGVATMDCNTLATQIVAHQPGDAIRLDVLRGLDHVVLHAVLMTRAEVLSAKFVGHELDSPEVTDLDDGTSYDLAHLHGRTHVLAWFDARECAACVTLVHRVVDTAESRKDSACSDVVAVTAGDPKELGDLRLGARLGVPVAISPDLESYFVDSGLIERDRAYFMVVDGSGLVRVVTPIATDDDDADAALDEVLAAADQAAHARR